MNHLGKQSCFAVIATVDGVDCSADLSLQSKGWNLERQRNTYRHVAPLVLFSHE